MSVGNEQYQADVAEWQRRTGKINPVSFDPWKRPEIFGAWAAYLTGRRALVNAIRKIKVNEWPSELFTVPTLWPHEFDLSVSRDDDMRAASAWVERIREMARHGELPHGTVRRLRAGDFHLPAAMRRDEAARERIKKGLDLLSLGKAKEAREAVKRQSATVDNRPGKDNAVCNLHAYREEREEECADLPF